jgi:hemolysin III
VRPEPTVTAQTVSARPRLRGVLHQWALLLALPTGALLVLAAEGSRARAAAAVFASSVIAMFGVSALYHRVTWSPGRRLLLRRLDHASIFVLIAGTYTPFGLLVLTGSWRIAVLAIVWTGAAAAVCLKLAWPEAPKWIAAAVGIGLGWVGVVAFPELWENAGAAATLLVLGGGVGYTLGAIVYVRAKPDPLPGVFGYHEVFHALVIAAVALQYAAVALVVV